MTSSNTSIFNSVSLSRVSIRDEAKDEAQRQIKRLADTMSLMRVSPAEVAKETGLSRQTVYRVLDGTPAKLETVIAIDRAVASIVKSRMEAVALIMGNELAYGEKTSNNVSGSVHIIG